MKFLIKKYKKNQYYRPGESGVAIILLVISLVFFLIFFLIFIDVAYVYYIRGQLQNAADSGALAGAAKLKPGDCTVDQSGAGGAIEEATAFALKNTAAGGNVVVDPTDIIFGNWDRANNPPFTPCSTSLSVNAIQVNAKKTTNYLTGEFGLVFGKIFDMAKMPIGASAIATRPGRGEAPLAICLETCDLAAPIFLYWPAPGGLQCGGVDEIPCSQIMAWTTIQYGQSTTSASNVRDFICDLSTVDACDDEVHSDQGNQAVNQRLLRCVFKDPLYDSANKVCSDGACDSSGDSVISWTVIVPVFDECPPSRQGANDPYTVVRYASITITEVNPGSSGNPGDCGGDVNCPNYSNPITGSTPDSAIRISDIGCVNCPEASVDLLGRKTVLVK